MLGFVQTMEGVIEMRTKTENEILDQLKVTEWMTLLELRERIGSKRNATLGPHPFGKFASHFSSTWGEVLSDRSPSIGEMLVVLEMLEEDGSIRARYRDDSPEVLERRGGKRRREWKLT